MIFFGKKKKAALPVESEGDYSYDEEAINFIKSSNLFDTKWHLTEYADLNQVDDLESHYHFSGWKEGRLPCYLFDGDWYLERYPDVKASGMNPLVHYIQYGDAEFRNPSLHFNARFYASQSPDMELGETTLGHYLTKGWKQGLNPCAEFDRNYYLESVKDIALDEVDAYKHYLEVGFFEGKKGSHLATSQVETYVDESFLEAGEHFEDLSYDLSEVDSSVKVIAYYLPQFHAFEENDNWWGKGFTEWRNVVRGRSRYAGHYQPRLPRDLGYYDLSNTNKVMSEQIALAKKSGVSGFCFYYYRFDNKRLLDMPIENFLSDTSLDMPFCLTWANENWTKTWDGMEDDVLMKQSYKKSSDNALIDDLARYFVDTRYIRINGKPLFIIYRPGIIPEIQKRVSNWKTLLKSRHNLDVLFYMVQGFGDSDPREFKMDGAIEFPPHKILAGADPINASLENLANNFSGNVFPYEELISRSLEVAKPNFDLFRGVCPDWDNEARRPNRGMAFLGSTPSKYQSWLEKMLSHAKQNPVDGESMVFVNAWNEWAEGAYLEPDIYWGSAYLNATARAQLKNDSTQIEGAYRVIYVGHDAHKHGAQLLSLHIVEQLIKLGVDVQVILLKGGDLVDDYRRIAPTQVLSETNASFGELVDSITQQDSALMAITNTAVTGECAKVLSEKGYKVVSLVHELSTLIAEYNLESESEAIASYSNAVVFASNYVKQSFESVVNTEINNALIMPQGVYKNIEAVKGARKTLLKKLAVTEADKIIINMGFGDLRKGFDLFVLAAQKLIDTGHNYHFVWLGAVEPSLQRWVYDSLDNSYKRNIHIHPFTDDVATYLYASDLFLLTSREDPFPSVVMEALGCGLPVVGFNGGGGFVDLLSDSKLGALAPLGNVDELVKKIEAELSSDSKEKQSLRKKIITESFNWKDYVFGLLKLLDPNLKKVSVVVPNYNYEQYISDRLESIFVQSYPIYEIIILDDCSPDNSLEVIKEVCKKQSRVNELVVNEKNSGNVFRQWKKGVDLASGDYIWIAEADDLAEPEFLSALCNSADDFTMAFCDSKQIDENGEQLADSYGYYYEESFKDFLEAGEPMSGPEFIKAHMAVKNQVLNVSAVVFKRKDISDWLDINFSQIVSFRVAGDWYIYNKLASSDESVVLGVANSYNVHRRHSSSVTHENLNSTQLEEINRMHVSITKKFEIDQEVQDAQSKYLEALQDVFER